MLLSRNICLVTRTLDFGLVVLRLPNKESGSFSVERIGWVRIAQELWEETLEDVDHIEHWRPCLVDDIQAHGSRPVSSLSKFPVLLYSQTYGSIEEWRDEGLVILQSWLGRTAHQYLGGRCD